MGIAEAGERVANVFTEFRGIKRIWSKRAPEDEGESDGMVDRGIRGGPQGAGASAQGRRASRAWTQFDAGGGNSEDLESGTRLYIVRGAQIFTIAICLFINIGINAFQSKWSVGPSGLVVLTYIICFLSLFTAIFMLVVPILHARASRFSTLARAISQSRPAFLINATWTTWMLILAYEPFVMSISANVKGCKNPESDPHADIEGYTDSLGSFCRSKRALAAFLWFSFFAWLVSLVMVLVMWKRRRSSGLDQPFRPPIDEDKEVYDHADEEHGPLDGADTPMAFPGVQYTQSRPSETYYDGGRPFDDAPPTGYGASSQSIPYPPAPVYEDPYDRIRRERLGL